jgi:hypothetical protein
MFCRSILFPSALTQEIGVCVLAWQQAVNVHVRSPSAIFAVRGIFQAWVFAEIIIESNAVFNAVRCLDMGAGDDI